MRYKILKDGEVINTIVADETVVEKYCEKHGYTYEADDIQVQPDPIPEPEGEASVWDELDAAYQEGVNSAYDQ